MKQDDLVDFVKKCIDDMPMDERHEFLHRITDDYCLNCGTHFLPCDCDNDE